MIRKISVLGMPDFHENFKRIHQKNPCSLLRMKQGKLRMEIFFQAFQLKKIILFTNNRSAGS